MCSLEAAVWKEEQIMELQQRAIAARSSTGAHVIGNALVQVCHEFG